MPGFYGLESKVLSLIKHLILTKPSWYHPAKDFGLGHIVGFSLRLALPAQLGFALVYSGTKFCIANWGL